MSSSLSIGREKKSTAPNFLTLISVEKSLEPPKNTIGKRFLSASGILFMLSISSTAIIAISEKSTASPGLEFINP